MKAWQAALEPLFTGPLAIAGWGLIVWLGFGLWLRWCFRDEVYD